MSSTKSAAQIFKEARLKKGLTRIELAKKAGVYTNTYYKIERGEQKPSYPNIKKLAKALGLDIKNIPA
jgi:transcriptional regulator with XRE-family HTH domain